MKRTSEGDIIDKSKLHIDGFEIYRNFVDIDGDSILKQMKKQTEKARVIFNHNETNAHNDNKRTQVNLKVGSKKMQAFMCIIKQKIHNLGFNHAMNNWVIIRSKPGCRDQAAHTDYVPSTEIAACPDNQMPLAILIALMPDTKIHVWPKSIRLASMNPELYVDIKPIKRLTITLNEGDLFIFRGDLVHAGSGYSEENIRLHCFMDSQIVPRTQNRTYLVGKHACQELKSIIVTK